jgi:predicted alpha/beta superfamily hydrolase
MRPTPSLPMRGLATCLVLVTACAHAQSRPSTAGPGVHVLAPPFAMPGLGRERTVRLYLPPSYDSAPERRYPVIYLHDGQNLFDDATSFAGEWGVDEAMDELARTRGVEAIVVGIDNGGKERMRELSPWTNPKYGPAQGEPYMAFVAGTLKPWIDARYRTRPGRESTVIGGSSMGGLISHYALLRWPQVFGKAIIFSPSYWYCEAVYDETRAHPWPAGTRVWFYIGGREDEESVPDVRRMTTLLATLPHGAGDYPLSINALGEHNERAWRAEFPRAVAWLLAPTP